MLNYLRFHPNVSAPALNFGKSPQTPPQPAPILPAARDGTALVSPPIFVDTFSNPTTRGLWNKIAPKFTLTPDEIRLSKAAERDQALPVPPWNDQNIFLPFPQH